MTHPEGPSHLWPDADILELCKTGIPSYDPWRDAGDCTFSIAKARHVVAWIAENLEFIEGEVAGQKMVLEPWQAAIAMNLFGWQRSPGVRRYRSCFLYVARKNNKTPFAAAIALYMLLCDGERGAQVYSAAADRDQAALIYRWAAGMAEKSPEIGAMIKKPYRTWKSIETADGTGVYKALSADAHTKHGLNISCAIIEELHAHQTRTLVDTLQSAKGSRKQPIFLYVTTADYARPREASICNDKYLYAKDVRSGKLKARDFLPVIYELDAADDWQDENLWHKANPNLGKSVKLDELREQAQEAKDNTGYQNEFRRLRLNQQTMTHIAAIDMQLWVKCAGPHSPEDLEKMVRGEPCYAGLDLGSTGDTTALARLFLATMEHPRIVLCRFWIPFDGMVERDRRDKVGYSEWYRRGLMRATPGNITDYNVIEGEIVKLHEETPFEVLNYDRANAADLVIRLQERHGLNCVEFGQGFLSMNAPCIELNRMVLSQGFWHGGNEVLTWMAGNVQWDTKEGALKPSKRYSTGRIDGISALADAIGAFQLAGPSDGWTPAVYSAGRDLRGEDE